MGVGGFRRRQRWATFVKMGSSINRLMVIQHLVFWIAFLLINLYTSFTFLPPGMALGRFAIVAVLNAAVYVFCYLYPVNRYFETKKYVAFVAVLVGTILVSAGIRAGALYLAHNMMEIEIPTLLLLDKKTFGAVLIIFTQGLVVLIATLLAISKNKILAEQKLAEILTVKTQTELSLLKAKINPHFLLNTLNNIYYFNQEESPKSGEAIIKLGELLRYTIYDSSRARIPLSRELETLESLRQLYAMRFRTEPDIRIRVTDEAVTTAEIPPGIALILFENALKYSAAGPDTGGYVKAEIGQVEGRLHIHVENSIADADRNLQNVYGGMGLQALKQMLELEYAGRYTLHTQAENKVYTATLSIAL